jgi:hypothetical protein
VSEKRLRSSVGVSSTCVGIHFSMDAAGGVKTDLARR